MNIRHARNSRAVVTPARIALAIAIAGVGANLYLMLNDALALQVRASARSTTSSSVEALRGRFPGEPKLNSDTQHWKTP